MGNLGPTVKLVFAGDASQLDKTMEQVGNSGDKMVKQFSLKSAGLAVAGGAAALGLASAFEQNLDIGAANAKLEAQIGAGSQMAADAGQIAGSLYADAYGDSLESVNDAVKIVLQSGAVMEDASNEQIQSITGNALSLSKAFGVDVQGSMNAVAQLMRTGLAPDAETAMDVITRGFQQGVDKGGDFLDTLNEYGTQFRKLGLDATAATGLMSQGLSAGARDADIVADALKELSIRAVDGSKTTVDAFTSLGFGADQMRDRFAQGGQAASGALDQLLDKLRAVQDPAERTRIAVELFGTQAEDLGNALFALDPSSAVAAMGNVKGAAQQVNDTLNDTAQNKITALQRGFQNWTNDLVSTRGPLGDIAGGLVAFGQPALDMASNIGMMALAFKGIGLSLFTSAIPAVWSFTAALLANPITWVVIGIAALIAAIVLMITHWDKVKQVVGIVVDWIVARWRDATGWIGGIAEKIGNFLGGMWDGVKTGAKAALNWVIDRLNDGVRLLNGLIHGVNKVTGIVGIPGIPDIPYIPKFHTGGVVPGAPGSEMLAILQAGETVIPAGGSVRSSGATVSFRGNTDSAFASAFMRLVRTGAIQVS
ncbi:phage tail tape measure protein [Amycolatopsis sp. Poz14]|uniref:phage tail tape measure protein n=1 Tax=Amycolatopsis sp. Poz14 TaxID=1447705 RepID=UPI001EE809C1|nr:phage tail tape measure protein [Amycolatopsis sp. Poz14]MCG3757369.1 phage tail tape measure protein [Amycolatopsis sp. Poz14]